MATLKHQKSNALYDTFERKGPGQKVTHYCPGCGHGVVHKMIAEAIEELGVKDKVVFASPVGCSVFAYYYFDTGNIQCSHGRAPAVGTGVVRTQKDSIMISYQGDGDLAGIGMGAIMHAANRGENMAVFFINNAIYGMTGGQMAPTTLPGQKTTTTPLGRDVYRDGNPIRMSELIAELDAPVFVERTSLGKPASVLKTKKAIKKALENQAERKGFSFVEILSPCPIGWKMSSVDARKWIVDALEPAYPVKKFKEAERPGEPQNIKFIEGDELKAYLGMDTGIEEPVKPKNIADQNVKIAGFGGQGVMSGGVLLADSALKEGFNSTWLPSYGPEMRGGTANASVNISNEAIGAPVVSNPNVLLAMNAPSLLAFEGLMQKDGLILLNSSLIEKEVKRSDVKVVKVPATELAAELGLIASANVIMLAVYIMITGVLSIDTLKEAIPQSLKRKNLVELNLKALEAGVKYYEENLKE